MNDNIRKWIAALRSGRYPQHRATLRGSEGYCCLGVACDISGVGQWNVYHYETESSRELDLMPREVCDWLGIEYDDLNPGDVEISSDTAWKHGLCNLPVNHDGNYFLSMLNDEGVDFDTIADVIKAEYSQ